MRTKKAVKPITEMVESVKQHTSAVKNDSRFIPSGCTVWNLACTGTKSGFLRRGTICNMIGDKDSGKTIGAMTVLASTFYQKDCEFKHFKYRDHECAVGFSVKKLFGRKFAEALDLKQVKPGPQATIEYMFTEIANLGKLNEPFIYVTDSWDAMTTMAEWKAMKAQIGKVLKAANPGQKDETKGSYGTEKARAGARYLGKIQQIIAETGSIVIIISQTRESMASFGFGESKTRSGGKAMGFYANIEMWLAKQEKIGKDPKRPIGGITEVRVNRSKVTGKPRRCQFPILYAYGIDNTRANIMFLLDEGVFKRVGGGDAKTWKAKLSGGIKLTGLDDFQGRLMECLEHIEGTEGLTDKLDDLVAQTWRDIEEEIRLEAVGNRRPKFS